MVSAVAIICSISFLLIFPSSTFATLSDLTNPAFFWSKVLREIVTKLLWTEKKFT